MRFPGHRTWMSTRLRSDSAPCTSPSRYLQWPYSLSSRVSPLSSAFAFCPLPSALCYLGSALSSLFSALCSLLTAPCTLFFTLCWVVRKFATILLSFWTFSHHYSKTLLHTLYYPLDTSTYDYLCKTFECELQRECTDTVHTALRTLVIEMPTCFAHTHTHRQIQTYTQTDA
jgi:hypothetical protein